MSSYQDLPMADSLGWQKICSQNDDMIDRSCCQDSTTVIELVSVFGRYSI